MTVTTAQKSKVDKENRERVSRFRLRKKQSDLQSDAGLEMAD
jgi:hypothetical protein